VGGMCKVSTGYLTSHASNRNYAACRLKNVGDHMVFGCSQIEGLTVVDINIVMYLINVCGFAKIVADLKLFVNLKMFILKKC
jgi:hypothetical protein